MLRLSLAFAFFLAFALSVASAPTPLITAAPAPILEERDVLEERAQKKKTTKKVAKKTTKKVVKAAAPTNKLYASSSSFTGKGTWFTQNGNPGSCGKWSNGKLSSTRLAKLRRSSSSCFLYHSSPTPFLPYFSSSPRIPPTPPRLPIHWFAFFALDRHIQTTLLWLRSTVLKSAPSETNAVPTSTSRTSPMVRPSVPSFSTRQSFSVYSSFSELSADFTCRFKLSFMLLG